MSDYIKEKIGLVQINNSFSGQNYFPYSVGILEAYARQHAEYIDHYDFLLPVYTRENVVQIVERLRDARAVFFSTYVWNIRISLAVAEAFKQTNPTGLVIFGGPQVPDNAKVFLEQNRCIDLVCHGEGERVFSQLLDRGLEEIRRRQLIDIPAISFLDTNSEFVTYPRGKRVEQMSEIPSPYLSGAFGPLMHANPGEKWIAMWETNRGCPFSCAFCDWGSATQARVYQFSIERLYEEIQWFAQQQIEFIFCADANFGMLPRDYDLVARVADVKKKMGYPHALSVQNTKNATERAYKVQKLLSDAGLNKGVTIALQSLDSTTLQHIKRSNISTASYQELQRRFTRDGVATYTDIILGLPGETYQSFTAGVSAVIENGQHNRIQFNNLTVLPNAEVGNPEYQRTHGMVIVESPVVNIHGSLLVNDHEVVEMQDLVVGTASCPPDDWCKVRVFSWLTALLYFNKLLQIPLLLLHANFNIGIHDLLTLFADTNLTGYPIFKEIQDFFYAKARDMQQGGAEYCSSPEWLNIWWPADELRFILLCTGGQLPAFYAEAEHVLSEYLCKKRIDVPKELLHEMIMLNEQLVKLPLQQRDIHLQLSYNLYEAYEAARCCDTLKIERQPTTYHIDRHSQKWDSWETWCREVVWWGNKKGAYLYTTTASEPNLAGHY